MTELERQRAIREAMGRAQTPARRAVLPTGFPSLDRALGGGFPGGGIVEVFGPSSCGKTSFALECVAHVQRSGLTAAWIDADRAFDPAFAASLGVDIAKTAVAVPESAEQALEMARALAGSCALDLVVIDSAAALVPGLELRVGLGEGGGLQARVLASGLRRLAQAALRSGAVILFLNQTRGRAAKQGEEETTAGGPSLKMHAAARISLRVGAGGRIAFRTHKNRPGDSFAEGELEPPGERMRVKRP
jgi:recombination protein RecA